MKGSRGGAALRSAVFLACAGVSALSAQSGTDEESLAAMVRGAARECASKLAAQPVLVRVSPPDAPPMVRQIFTEEAAAAGAQAFSDPAHAAIDMTVDVRGMRASAVSLGNSSYLRNLSASFGVLAGDRRSGAVLWSKEYRLSRSDTLRGVMPETDRDFRDTAAPGWMESILTPVLVTAAAAVIIVLLFTVRGS